MSGNTRTADEWAEAKGFRIMDADGWRTADAPPWDEPISETEFDLRASVCTIAPRDWGQQ